MKKVISILCVIMFCFSLTACNNSYTNKSKQTSQDEAPKSNSTQKTYDIDAAKTLITMDLSITVGSKVFSAKLYNNQTTRALVEKLPLTIDMSELNDNEKYYYLSNMLPATSEQPGQILANNWAGSSNIKFKAT